MTRGVKAGTPANASVSGSARRIRPDLLLLAVFALVIGVAGASSFPLPLLATLVLAGSMLLAFSFPRELLPSVAFVAFVVFPISYLPINLGVPQGTVTPAALIIAVWLARLIGVKSESATPRSLTVFSALSLLALIAGTLISSEPLFSAIWSGVVTVLVIVPLMMIGRVDASTARALRSTWVWCALVLSLLGIAEGIIGANPLEPFYTVEQHWSVHRVMTTLGHPLMNGAFFSTSTVFLGIWAVRERKLLPGVAAVLAAGATAFTASRSGVLALLIGGAVALVLLLCTSRVSFTVKLLGTLLFSSLGVLVAFNPVLRERLSSAEAASSADYRDTFAIGEAQALFQDHPVFGFGPGTATRHIFDQSGYVLENAMMGSLASLGLVGAILLLALLLSFMLFALRQRSIESIGALIGFLVVGFAFPFWESVPSALMLATSLIVASPAPPSSRASTAARTTQSIRRESELPTG